MWFHGQFGRFLTKEFSITHILKKTKVRFKLITEIITDLKLCGQKEILVSHYEDKLSAIRSYKTTPFVDPWDKVKGFRIIFHKEPVTDHKEATPY